MQTGLYPIAIQYAIITGLCEEYDLERMHAREEEC
jgi:hypothetical protein